MHFVHYPGAVDLDRARADRQIVGDRFVGQSREQALQHLAFARREQLPPLLPFDIDQMPSPRFRPKLQSTPPA